jgi:hypothetical protein
LFRNGCIAAVASLSAVGAAHAAGSAEAASTALDAALADVNATSPKVMLVVATVVGVGILIGLMRKA